MAGQQPENEDIGLLSLSVWVYGCPLDPSPKCGDGNITFPEQCDNGAENGQSNCSLACTWWQPAKCHDTGHCLEFGTPQVVAQVFPGMEPSQVVDTPRWTTIANVNYHSLFTTASSASSASCPGNLQKHLHPLWKVFICAPPPRAEFNASKIEPFSFLVVGTPQEYVAIRGQAVLTGKGWASWLTADMPM